MKFIEKVKDFIFKDDIGEPPWEYDFLVNLDEGLRPLYLKKIFKYRTDEDLPIKKVGKNQWIIDKKKCKTFNQKIQWIKLHGITDLMRTCTDKVAVRDYVRERIGEEYLKPVLQIIGRDGVYISPVMQNSFEHLSNDELIKELENNRSINKVEVDTRGKELFDLIDFEKLPNSFVMKCNHGCKWQYIIKKKDEYLSVPRLMEITKRQMTGWLEQEFWPWEGFEMQYATSRRVESHNDITGVRTRECEGKENDRTKSEVNCLPERKGCQEKGIEPKILIEPYMVEKENPFCKEIMVYCSGGEPKIIMKIHNKDEITFYDTNLNITEDIFNFAEQKIKIEADENIKKALELSKLLTKELNFVRVDWMLYKDNLYFEELTFTPYSGFNDFTNKREKKSVTLIRI